MYNKIFTSILDSSIWLEKTSTRIVWVTLLAAMDEEGFVRMATIRNLASRARVTEEEAEEAAKTLESADMMSPGQEMEGRRIERVDGGWMVLNAGKYRDIVNREHEKEQTRIRVARHREKLKNAANGVTPKVTPVTNSTEMYGKVTTSEAEAEATTATKKIPASPAGGQNSVSETGGDTELGNPPSGAAPPKSEMRFFSDGWGAAYKERYGGAYDFKKEDGIAVARLLKLGTAQEMLVLARQAWEQTDAKQFWACINQSATVAKFGGALSAIRVELSRLKPKAGKGQKAVVLTPLQIRLGGLFGRKAADRWSEDEIRCSENAFELESDDWDKLEGYFSCKYADVEEYRVKNLLGLLNNFQRELDKARSVANRKPY